MIESIYPRVSDCLADFIIQIQHVNIDQKQSLAYDYLGEGVHIHLTVFVF